MRIFVYEFLAGGGTLAREETLPESLLCEGRAMVSALADDFSRIDGVLVDVLRDARVRDLDIPGVGVHQVDDSAMHLNLFTQLAGQADWTIVIAPEFDGHLFAYLNQVLEAGGRVLGPGPAVARLAGDKEQLCRYLAARGVPVPNGRFLEPDDALPRDFTYPAVVKRVDGAGSLDVRWVLDSQYKLPPAKWARRLERFCPGEPVSVAFLSGPDGQVALPPCRQRLSDDGRFTYLGGALPLEPNEAARAESLARRAVAALPEFVGYLGVDLVLGGDPHGSGDVVIEINPRLTTSYIGLRAASQANLAAAMLAVAGGEVPALSFSDRPVEFRADGNVTIIGDNP